MAVVGVADQYLILIAITLLFTVLGISETEASPRKIILQMITAICWFVSAYVHLLSGDITSIITVAPTYLFGGLGLVFSLSAIYSVFAMGIREGGP